MHPDFAHHLFVMKIQQHDAVEFRYRGVNRTQNGINSNTVTWKLEITPASKNETLFYLELHYDFHFVGHKDFQVAGHDTQDVDYNAKKFAVLSLLGRHQPKLENAADDSSEADDSSDDPRNHCVSQ